MCVNLHEHFNLYRQKELKVLVRDTQRHTLLADVAARCLSTSKRRLALLAHIHMQRPEDVRAFDRLLTLNDSIFLRLFLFHFAFQMSGARRPRGGEQPALAA